MLSDANENENFHFNFQGHFCKKCVWKSKHRKLPSPEIKRIYFSVKTDWQKFPEKYNLKFLQSYFPTWDCSWILRLSYDIQMRKYL